MAGTSRRQRCGCCRRFFHKDDTLQWVRLEMRNGHVLEKRLVCSPQCARDTLDSVFGKDKKK